MDRVAAPIAAQDYCRRARRLRHTYAGQPSRLHRALTALSKPPAASPVERRPDVAPATAREQVTVCPAVLLGVPPDQEAAVRRFVAHVRQCVANRDTTGQDVSRHSLLRVADRLQIGRFHANLVIAAILHESSPGQATTPRRALPTRWALVTAIVATQATLLGAAALVWRWMA